MPAARVPTKRQVSAGGVVVRHRDAGTELALICVGPKRRWQLPKGIVDEGESPEATAIREVREEAGVDAHLVAPLDVIEYWYVGNERGGERVRYHKFVHFFLLEYDRGDVRDHDSEVEEARWVPTADVESMLAFTSEKKVVVHALQLLAGSS